MMAEVLAALGAHLRSMWQSRVILEKADVLVSPGCHMIRPSYHYKR